MCKIIYYELIKNKWHKCLRQITFSDSEIDVTRCVLTFKKIAEKYNENIGYEPNYVYTNGVYTYFSSPYQGYSTALDMNSAYLYALSQKLADWESKREIGIEQVFSKEYDYYLFENPLHSDMYYKEDTIRMQAAMLWADTKIYGFKSKHYFQNTVQELYKLKKKNPMYKNVANIYVGCMHKKSGKRNNSTIAASLYAWFAWYIDSLVRKFIDKGYKVIMVTTDSIKIRGKYNTKDGIIKLGDGLGEFKIEFEGESTYYSQGHYEDNKVKWKGKPQYMIDGYPKCQFIDNLKEEKKIYVKYAKI